MLEFAEFWLPFGVLVWLLHAAMVNSPFARNFQINRGDDARRALGTFLAFAAIVISIAIMAAASYGYQLLQGGHKTDKNISSISGRP